MAIKHAFTSGKSDPADTTLVKPSDWNASHTIEDSTVSEAKLTLSDNTTNDATTSRHGFLKKLNNQATYFMNGAGDWAVPTVAASSSGGTYVIDDWISGTPDRSGGTNYYSQIASAVSDINSYGGGTLHFPAGIYLCSTTVDIPSHVNLSGVGGLDPTTSSSFDGSWLKGFITFNSYSTFRDLKIGTSGGYCTPNTSASEVAYTAFERVRFRGGTGVGEPTATASPTFFFTSTGSGDRHHLVFSDCIFERSLASVCANTVSMTSSGMAADQQYHDINFTRCIFGAYNGSDTGSTRFCFEVVHSGSNDGVVEIGWKHIDFHGCTFFSDTAIDGLDRGYSGLSFNGNPLGDVVGDYPDGYYGEPANGWSNVIGCHFTGGVKNAIEFAGFGIAHMNVVGCTFWNYRTWILAWGRQNGPHTITGNTFDSTYANGIAIDSGYKHMLQNDRGGTISGNSYSVDDGSGVFYCYNTTQHGGGPCENWIFEGNRVQDLRSTGSYIWYLEDDASDIHISNNYTYSRAGNSAVVYIKTAEAGVTGITVTGNRFDNGSDGPAWVENSGEIIHWNNWSTNGTETGVLDPVPQFSSAPTWMERVGAMYYNTSDNNLYVYTGSGWTDLTA